MSLAHCLSTNLNYIKNFLNQITFFLVLEAIIYSIVGLLSFERQTNHNWMVVTFQFFLRTQTKSDVDGLGYIENESLLWIWPSPCGNHLRLFGHLLFIFSLWSVMSSPNIILNWSMSFDLDMFLPLVGMECGLEMLVVICGISTHIFLPHHVRFKSSRQFLEFIS